MADQDSNRKPKTDRKQNENDNEWLRDDVGEDRNLSGSSTSEHCPTSRRTTRRPKATTTPGRVSRIARRFRKGRRARRTRRSR